MFYVSRFRFHEIIVKDFLPLERKLNLKFKNKDLLIQAFIHRSYLNENPNTRALAKGKGEDLSSSPFSLEHNERMEFLGDAVLELVVTEELYKKYPTKPEGELTSWRASLVNAKILARVAKDVGFNNFLLLSKGEQKELGKARQYILANTFESFIGALYLDQDYAECQKFIKKYLIKELPDIIKRGLHRDSKSCFQEEAQEEKGITPTYKVLKEHGPDHAKHFLIGVFLGEKLIAQGEGYSKQEAEEMAAKNALTKKLC